MKTTLMALTAVMISGVASAHSSFQDSATSLEGVAIRIGLAFPTDNKLSSSLSNTISSFGLEFGGSANFGKGSSSYLGLEYYGKNVGQFSKGSVTTATYNVRIYKDSGTTRRTYTVVGAGVAFADLVSSETLILVRGGFGVDVSDHTFFEGIGTVSNSGDAGSFNTIGLYFGYRF